MVDQLADSPEEMFQKAVEWIEAHPIAVQPWDEVDKKTGKIKAEKTSKYLEEMS
jgi:3-hydroxyacyl-CoA dehydrogenase/enoyl-CoA hydratase/3-hydroxybutyryl-CoA epimerase